MMMTSRIWMARLNMLQLMKEPQLNMVMMPLHIHLKTILNLLMA